jgi:hypothetical protein
VAGNSAAHNDQPPTIKERLIMGIFNFLFGNETPSGPSVNVDGTPMIGDSGIDIHGNTFGITSDDSFGGIGSGIGSAFDDTFSSSSDSFGSSFSDPFSSF